MESALTLNDGGDYVGYWRAGLGLCEGDSARYQLLHRFGESCNLTLCAALALSFFLYRRDRPGLQSVCRLTSGEEAVIVFADDISLR